METNYKDSQESADSMNDIFADPPSMPTENVEERPESCRMCKQNNTLLKEILKELREQRASPSLACVETSVMERPLMEYSKSRFAVDMYLNSPDVILKRKITSLKRQFQLKEDLGVLYRISLKYACRKMTDFRAQVKAKILSGNKDLGNLPLKEFSQVLFGKFAKENLGEEVEQNAILIRSFCHENKLLKKIGSETPLQIDFWGEYQDYQQKIKNDTEDGKWVKMRLREEKRIERYQKL